MQEDQNTRYCTISFNSVRGGQEDKLAEIWTSAILRGGISQISAKIKSSAILVTCDVELTQAVGDLAKAMDFE